MQNLRMCPHLEKGLCRCDYVQDLEMRGPLGQSGWVLEPSDKCPYKRHTEEKAM